MAEKVFLIDGNSMCYRAFYAIRELSNSKGEPTNAVYGVITMLRKIIKQDGPRYLGVCFDMAGPTFRHEMHVDYKAHRKPMPDDLVTQIPWIKDVIKAYKIPIYEKAGFEADDLIGTLSVRIAERGYDVFIVTGDKDMLQLVNDRIKVYNTNKEGLIYDSEEVKKKFEGLGPEKVVEIMALMGDSSDNIPGVPHIGPKTALSLIKEFGSVESIYQNLDKIKSENQRKLLGENESLARRSRDLATIELNAPVEFEMEDLRLKDPDAAKLVDLFTRFEFRTLLKDLTPTGELESKGERHYHTVKDAAELRKLAGELKKAGKFAVDTETTSADPHLAALVGMSFSFQEKEAYYVPVSSNKHQGPGIPEPEALSILKPLLEDGSIRKFGQNIKYDLTIFRNHGIELSGIDFDTMVASYLINPSKRNHNLDDISFEHLQVKKIATKDLIFSGKKEISMDQVPLEKISEYACEDADCVWRLQKKLAPMLKTLELEKLFHELEMPLVEVLGEIEMNGVKVDTDLLKEMSREAEECIETITKKIFEEAGEEFNINSPKQVGEILFTKMNLAKGRRTKTGFSTDVEVLERLAEEHKIAKLLLDCRERSKLKSTYFDALQNVNPKTGLIHTSFNQTVTATGRLSSSEPNLQNIPIRTEAGRLIRKAFVPRAKNRKILSADYSQIELRFLAHFSEDPALLKAFKDDVDVHSYTASLLYGTKPKDVTWEMRNLAKTINFSIIYGKTAYGLSRDLSISIEEADEFIKNYFQRYPKVSAYLEGQKEKAKRHGYLTTILGRRAYFPALTSSNAQLRQFAERAAINAPLQGSAADLVKLAMVTIQKELKKQKMETLMILQVHDELVFDAPEKELGEVTEMIREKMESAMKLKVPLKVDVHTGRSWYKEH